jgi:hypothetical protein
MFHKALTNVAKEQGNKNPSLLGKSIEFLTHILPGDDRRMLHDDITIVIVNLKDQLSKK